MPALQMDSQPGLSPLSNRQEIVNGITHGMGFVMALLAAPSVVLLAMKESAWHMFGASVYAFTLVSLYAASTLSHVFHFHATWRRIFRMLDQGCIYLLIAGTYTPFAVVYFHDGWYRLLNAAMWTTAALGFASKVFFAHRVDSVATWAYVVLGWLPIVTVPRAIEVVPHECLLLMIGGGACYTIGTFFLMLDRRVPFFHAVWHLLVIAGSTLHYIAIIAYVLPQR
ncbi:MAG: hemolysin III family protein [Pirellulales bacterium]|nr:hemolysin III family protein [Pirellulales bacterium]